MILKKLVLAIFLILLISGCQTRINIGKACGIGEQYEKVNAGLDEHSVITDYQAALVIRHHENEKRNRSAKQKLICVNEIQRYLK